MRFVLCLMLVAGCAVDPDDDSALFDDEILDDGKGDPAEKDRWDAIASCRTVCVEKYTAMCPTMDTVAEYLACRDACAVQTYSDACEDEYIELNECRTAPAVAYTCNGAGNPVATASCTPQRTLLAYCELVN